MEARHDPAFVPDHQERGIRAKRCEAEKCAARKIFLPGIFLPSLEETGWTGTEVVCLDNAKIADLGDRHSTFWHVEMATGVKSRADLHDWLPVTYRAGGHFRKTAALLDLNRGAAYIRNLAHPIDVASLISLDVAGAIVVGIAQIVHVLYTHGGGAAAGRLLH